MGFRGELPAQDPLRPGLIFPLLAHGDMERPLDELDLARSVHRSLEPFHNTSFVTMQVHDYRGVPWDMSINAIDTDAQFPTSDVPLGLDERPLEGVVQITFWPPQGSEREALLDGAWVELFVGGNGTYCYVNLGEELQDQGLIDSEHMLLLGNDVADFILPAYSTYLETHPRSETAEVQDET
ncbi:MAG TPA: hypothetical protein VJP80_06690 [Candidatus Saccharimonadales bacterium]|nr:hypothetical protein [Candidatus Saccharimonadales bacterium]